MMRRIEGMESLCGCELRCSHLVELSVLVCWSDSKDIARYIAQQTSFHAVESPYLGS